MSIKKTRKQRGGDASINPLYQYRKITLKKPVIPTTIMKHRILEQFSNLVTLKRQCKQQCVTHTCIHRSPEICEDIKRYVTEKPAVSIHGFCSGLMVPSSETCDEIPGNVRTKASNENCICFRLQKAYQAFDALKSTIVDTNIKRIATELLDYINVGTKAQVSNDVRRIIKFVRQSAQRKIDIGSSA